MTAWNRLFLFAKSKTDGESKETSVGVCEEHIAQVQSLT